MATSFGFKAFARRMKVISEKVGDNVEDVVRRAAIAADRTIVFATPVDTGRARGNWRVGIGSPSFAVSEATDQSGAGTVSAGASVISTWKIGKGPIFISNSVPYIVDLDRGTSAQAPNGMSAAAILAARKTLGGANILLRKL